MTTTEHPRARGRALMATALLIVVAALGTACAPAPSPAAAPTSEQEPAINIFAGGTYPLSLAVPAQVARYDFDFFGLGTCTTVTTTPSFRLVGTMTLGAMELDPNLTAVIIPSAAVSFPGAVVSAGSVVLECLGIRIGSVGLTVNFDGAASVRAARLDLTRSTVTLLDPVLSITNASFRLGDFQPVPLDPFTANVPSIDIVV
jgi:hypothetical protein